MGVDPETIRAIVNLRKFGLVGAEILCLGRSETYASRKQLKKISNDFKLSWNSSQLDSYSQERYAEGILHACGFENVMSLDGSDYEGADIIHDLNKPLPAGLKGCTSFLYDGGTLEHVFDVATAMRSMIGLVKIGGVIVSAPPANGQCGHGFYQFSPEFFYRTLGMNGFEVAVYITSLGESAPARWFKAKDPAIARRRITFMSGEPLQLIVVARKEREMEEFSIPQQSDYAEQAWNEGDDSRDRMHALHKSFKHRLRLAVQNRMAYPAGILMRATIGTSFGTGMPGLWRKQLFTPFDPTREALLN